MNKSKTIEIIYGSQWEEKREWAFQQLREGKIIIEVDYNRSPWNEKNPEDCLIWRVYIAGVDSENE